VQEELSRAKRLNNDLATAQDTDAAQHGQQLAKLTEEKQLLEKEVENVKSQHNAAITKAEEVT